MKLSDLMEMSFTEATGKMKMVELKVHSDDEGTVCAVEVKYVPGEDVTAKPEPKCNPWQ